MKVVPTEFKCLIRTEEIEGKSKGGIWYPDTSRERMQYGVDRGELLAVGEGFFAELPGPVPKVGDNVLFNKYAGTLLEIDEREKEGDRPIRNRYRLCNDKDICAILVEEK